MAAFAMRLEADRLTLSDDSAALRSAADELLRLLGPSRAEAITSAVDPALAALPDGVVPLPGDGWQVAAATLHGLRRQIAAVGEQLGWRWYYPGPAGERYLPGVAAPGRAGTGRLDLIVLDRARDVDPARWRAEALALIGWLPRVGVSRFGTDSRRFGTDDEAVLRPALAVTGVRLERLPAAAASAPPDQRAPRLWTLVHRGRRLPLLPHADPVATGNLAGPRPRAILRDLRSLVGAGFSAAALVTWGRLSWWATPLNLYVAARCAEDPALDLDALLDDWSSGLFGHQADSYRAWIDAAEQALEPLWCLPAAALATQPEGARPPDPRSLAAALDQLPSLRRSLAVAAQRCNDPLVSARLDAELTVFDLTYLHLQLWLLRLEAQLDGHSMALHAAGRELVGQIRTRLARLPAGIAGVAIAGPYRQTIDRLASWCGQRAPRAAARA